MFFQAADAVLAAAASCLGSSAPSSVFVYQGRPPADCCEILASWVESVGFSSEEAFPSTQSTPVRCGDLFQIIDVRLLLLRSCWPAAEASGVLPTPEAMETATFLLSEQAAAIICCLQTLQAEGTLLPWPHRRVVFGSVTPVAPQGGCAGWEFALTVETPPCCGMPLGT